MLHHKVILKKGDLSCKTFGVFASRGKHYSILHLRLEYPLQCFPLRQSSPVLRILNMKGCAIPRRSGLSSRSLGSVHDSGMGILCSVNDFSGPGHLRLQHGNICAALG
jgi:hypothetical protein